MKELLHPKFFHYTENHLSYHQWSSAHVLGTLLNRTHPSSLWKMHVSSLEQY